MTEREPTVDGADPEQSKENGLAWHSHNNITRTVPFYSTVNAETCSLLNEVLEPYLDDTSPAALQRFRFQQDWDFHILPEYSSVVK
jgi:hypothetical protein